MINKIDSRVPDFLILPHYKVYRHLILQSIILFITSSIFVDPSGKMEISLGRFYAWIGYFVIIDSMIYFNLYLLAPLFLIKGKLLGYLISVVGLILFSIIGVVILQKAFYDFDTVYVEKGLYMLLNVTSSIISLGLMILGTSTLLLFKYWISYNQRIDELAESTLQSELKFLKKQINPHFLFNMLNNANVLIKKNPEEASRVLFKLEDLLRYQINDSIREKVLLSSEIHFLNDFLNLEKLRRDNFEYFIFKEGPIDQVGLPPLLLIPFVENAVKHNSDSENKSYVYLSFEIRDDRLIFRCKNSKPATVIENQVGGLGLKNIRRRLELLYPDQHTFEILENDTNYTVNLSLKL